MFKQRQTHYFRLLMVLLCLGLVPLVSADVSGTWNFAVEVMGQGGNASVTMTQSSDGTLTGHYTGQLGDTDFTGSASGNDMQFALVGAAGTVTYQGTVQADGSIRGTVDLGGMAEGTFVATKSN